MSPMLAYVYIRISFSDDMYGANTGTGKSLLLKAIITALRKKYAKKPEVVSVTASTGMAASNIGGEFLITRIKSYQH